MLASWCYVCFGVMASMRGRRLVMRRIALVREYEPYGVSKRIVSLCCMSACELNFHLPDAVTFHSDKYLRRGNEK